MPSGPHSTPRHYFSNLPDLPAATHPFAPELFGCGDGASFWFQSVGPNCFARHRHPHTQMAIGYNVRGGELGWQETGRPAVEHPANGDVVWCLPQHTDHTVRLRHTGFWIVFYFAGSADVSRDLAVRAAMAPLNDYIRREPLIGDLGAALRRERQGHRTEDTAHVTRLGALLGSCLLRAHTREMAAAHPRLGLSREIRERLRLFLVAHLREPLTVPVLARAVGLAPDHFTRRLKFSTGLTTEQFIRHERLNHAKLLLCAGGHTVEQVAELCGFRSHATMTKQFTLRFGRPPRNYLPGNWRF